MTLYTYCGSSTAHEPHEGESQGMRFTCLGTLSFTANEVHCFRSEAVDMVNHPPHYKAHSSGVEYITVAEHFGFNLGNAIKYIWRADHKNGLEDLKKARWYLNREIARLEK